MKTIHKAKTSIDKKIFDKRTSVYDININLINNKSLNLKKYKGKYIMFVNVASNCGFTKQYEELQLLYDTYKNDLIVIGSPCNQFGGQEPGNNEEIERFCKENYNVTFILTEKIDVKGNNQHPLYKWLTSKDLNGRKRSSIKWNFQKFLIDKEGNLIDYFYSITKPMSTKITKYLK